MSEGWSKQRGLKRELEAGNEATKAAAVEALLKHGTLCSAAWALGISRRSMSRAVADSRALGMAYAAGFSAWVQRRSVELAKKRVAIGELEAEVEATRRELLTQVDKMSHGQVRDAFARLARAVQRYKRARNR